MNELKENQGLLGKLGRAFQLIVIFLSFVSFQAKADYLTFAPIPVGDITTFIPVQVSAVETASTSTKTAYYGESFSYQISVSSDPATTTYALINAPAGMTINEYGQIIWNSSAWGSVTVQIQITDAAGNVTTKTLTINTQPRNDIGDTQGELSVSQDGSAFYTVPISLSPGTAGMEPTLALTYNNQSGNGVLGMGWTLGGLSAITRCGSTLAEDGIKRSIQLNANDHLCLEGERLKQVGTGSDNHGSYIEYRKDMDPTTRIRGYGSADGQPINFRVWAKSGQIFSYGQTADSRSKPAGRTAAVTWGVNKIEDSAGNYLTVTYINDATNGDFRPSRIDYTGNAAAGLTPYNSVRFSYEDRSDKPKVLIAGKTQQVMKRMTAIQAYAGNSLVHEYHIDYQQSSGSGMSLLKTITECAGGTCFKPLTFNWQAATGSLQYGGAVNRSIQGNTVRAGDVNGDGLDDLVSLKVLSTTSTSRSLGFYLKLATPTGFGSDQSIGTVTLSCIEESVGGYPAYITVCAPFDFALGDVDGDGLADLSYLKATGVKSTEVASFLRISNGTGFAEAVNVASFTRPCKSSTQWGVTTVEACETFRSGLGDINGDGKEDLVYTTPESYESGTIKVYRKLSNGQTFGLTANPVNIARRCANTGGGIDYSVTCYPYSFDLDDVDGDGMMDLVSSKSDVNEFRVTVNLSDGSGFGAAKSYNSPRVGGLWLGDINGDGLADMVSYESPDAYESSNKIYMQLSEGSNFGTIAQLGAYSTRLPSGALADFNGDGLADFVSAGEYNYDNQARVRTVSAPTNDLLTGVTTPLGVSTTINYSRLSNTNVYTPGGAESYPQRTLNAKALVDVVSSVVSPNGLGGTSTTRYQYTHGVMDLEGRGFLGFASMTTTDQTTGVNTTTQYSQNYPYSGQTLSTQTKLADGTVISELENTLAVKSLFNGKVLLPYVAQNDQAQYETDGQLISFSRTTYTLDNFGNNTDIIVETSGEKPDTTGGIYDKFTTHTVNSYVNDTANWYLGRLTRVDNTQTTPDGQSATRSSAFEYDAATGLLNKEIVEPDNAALKLATTYTYDVFGNQTSATVSGVDIESRTTTTTWGERTRSNFDTVINNGRFAVASQNALGHSEQTAYDPRFGKATQLRGPNGLDTIWTYDNFGRVLKEIRADGTETETQRALCDSSCPTNGVMSVYTQSSGSAPATTVTDALGRGIRTSTLGRNGQIIYSDTEYDNRGQIKRKSQPYFAGSTPLWHTFTYDEMGRVTSEVAPDGSETITGFQGLSTTVRNANNQLNTRETNVRGEIVQVFDNGINDTFYRYDAFGNLIETEDAEGNIIQNTFDIRGRKIAMSDPDMGNWTYQYNVLGELINQTDAKGQTVTMTYDKLGRMLSRIEPEGTSTWTYDTAINGIGKLAEVTGSAGDIKTYQYDSLGRASSVTTLIDAQSYSVSTTYDSLSRVSTITYPQSQKYPAGLIVGYSYTEAATDGANGYLKTVSNQIDGTVYWQATAQNAAGQLTELQLGNGVTSHYDYTPETGLINSIQSSSAGGANDIQNLGFTFDAIGNLTKRSDYNQWLDFTALHETFQYDSLNRMTSSQVYNQTAKTYSYDNLGNITFKTGVGSYSYGQGAGPHAVTSVDNNGVITNYSYDANGNMITGAGRSISYTSYNKPTAITTSNADIRFTYGADRSRVKRENLTTGKVRYYIGDLFEQEQHNQITTYTHYIKAAGGTIAIETSKSNSEASTHYLHKDHLGSVTTITDQNGLIVEEQSYDAHGKRRNSDWTDIAGPTPTSATTDRGFTGHEHIDEVGLVHMNGRVYDPTLGRFISADPHIQEAYNSQSLNRYSYVLNNPLSYTDPSGFFFGKLFKSIFKAIGSIFKGVAKLIKSILNNKVLRTIVAIAIMVVPGAQPLGIAMIQGFAAGYIGSGGDLRAGIVGALTAGAFHGIGEHFASISKANVAVDGGIAMGHRALTIGEQIAKSVAHGVVGGASAVLNGGKFSNGFWSAGVTQGFSRAIGGLKDSAQRIVAAAAVGGTTSVLGGGKFTSGALTGAFSRVFNDEAHIGFSFRIPSSIGKFFYGERYIGKGFSAGIAISWPGFTGGKNDIGIYATALSETGNSDPSLPFGGIGRWTVGYGPGDVQGMRGQGSEVTLQATTLGTTINYDQNGRFSGHDYHLGWGAVADGSATYTRAYGLRDAFSNVRNFFNAK